MSNFEETIDDIKNRFLANPEEVSFLEGLTTEADNSIEETIDEINLGRSLALKKPIVKQ